MLNCKRCANKFEGSVGKFCPACYQAIHNTEGPFYYLFLSRPPGIGCQPDGFDIDTRVVWMPGRIIDGRNCLGRMAWTERLSPRDVWHYSLRPDSKVERAWLVFWNRDKNEFNQYAFERYMQVAHDRLREYAVDHLDQKAAAALILLDAGFDSRDGMYGEELQANRLLQEEK